MAEKIVQDKALEIIESHEKEVVCDGPEFSKHPRVYLNMGKDDYVVCPYCSRRFQLSKQAKEAARA